MKTDTRCAEAPAARAQVTDLLQIVAAGRRILEKPDQTGYVELKRSGAEPESSGEADRLCEEDQVRVCAGTGSPVSDLPGRKDDAGGDPSSSSSPRCVEKTETSLQLGGRSARVMTHPDTTGETERTQQHEEEKARGDGYLSGRSESEDSEEEEEEEDEGLVLFYESGPFVTEDESHYITTHEIQLSELSDHEGDFGAGSSAGSWDIEDDSQVYPFVDYRFEGEKGRARRRAQGAAAVSTLPESDPRAAAKFSSSEEQSGGNSGGQIHLSIRTTSRAINDPGNVQDQENVLYHARRAGDMSRCVFRGVDGKAEALCDKCLIAAPGRLHFGGKLRGKEVTEHSSGTSSAVSELDDADKEVRSLTAKAFRSLAQPYFDAFSFSTSSESSASDLNRWSTVVDLKYGNMNVDQSVVSCQNPDSRAYKGIKPPSSKLFTLSGAPRTQQIQLMGKFGQGHGGVIRLTETLNFRCNVKSAGERRAQCAQSAAGSRSADEITNSALSGASRTPLKTMEDTHKKAVFASSLIKNVLSKKMQFEQERRMERGEIREPQQEGDRWKEGRRGSKFSQSSSDYNIVCLDELGDIVDSGSSETRSESRRRDRSAPAPQTNLEAASGDGIDTKKGAVEASRSTLLRSQNSAFRCWKDEELGFPKDQRSRQTLQDNSEADQPSGSGKLTQMSHLFVPSIQLLSGDGEAGQQLQSADCPRDGGGLTVRSDNTLYITDSGRLTTSKSPEIKINLRSVKDNRTEHLGVSKLRAPNIGSGLIRTDNFKCQALAAALRGESSDKVPHFMVRDIRDNKGKLQTPIHQVRDVRKLVKSSYHFVSLDNENKSNFVSADSNSEQKKHNRNPNSVSPIVIKCQSVNTNNTEKQAGNLELVKQEPCDTDRSEGAKSGPPQGSAGPALSEGELRAESTVSSNKQDKESETADKKPESKIANQMALEKLQAAVKTMEQLYVFDKNEWKRKTEPQPLTDSHVLSLIASEELGGPGERPAARGPNMDTTVRRDSYPNIDKTPPALATSPGIDGVLRREDADLKVLQTSSSRDERLGSKSVPALSTTGSKSKSNKTSTTANARHPNTITQTPLSNKNLVPKSPKLPVTLKISQTGRSRKEAAERRDVERFEHLFSSTSADNENYLAIPVKSHLSNSKPVPSADKTSANTFAAQTRPTSPPRHEGSESRSLEDHIKRSSIVMETHPQEVPPATIYHSVPLGISASQPQVYCFSPAVTPAPTLDPFQATQRKMLLDPTTGNYYLVDTPVQPATKRLFDPETGHYVEVPMPQPPMTPVPMPISPLALSPGAYGHAYMIYPSFVPTPSVIPARTLVQSQMSVPSEAEGGDKTSSQQNEGMYMDSPFYMSTGKAPQPLAACSRPQHSYSSFKQPVISITSQQGPRIIAPPSFDGTTMSFVVEHR